MAKLTKTQEKIIIAAGLDPATIRLESCENVWMQYSPSEIQIFDLYGADKCEKAMASKDLGCLDIHSHDDDRFVDSATFSFCFYEKCKTCKSKKCERKTGGVR